MRRATSRRLALWCWYRGDAYLGYQMLASGPTVEASLRAAFQKSGIDKAPSAASRTDKGVHARMQVLHLNVDAAVDPSQWAERWRQDLPADIGLWATWAPPHFHAHWSASGKVYRYRIHAPAHPRHCSWALDVDPQALVETLQGCVGTRDFSAFHENSSARKLRTLHSVSLRTDGSGAHSLFFHGQGFGRYQIRYMIGSAALVCQGLLRPQDFAGAVETAQSIAGQKAPAHGLVLWECLYPDALDPFAAVRPSPPWLPSGPPFEG